MKPRRISPISAKRAVELALYAKAKREWWARLTLHFSNVGFVPCERMGCWNKAEKSPHHTRGRIGALLCDWRFWKALCRKCHAWVHNNPENARRAGLLCEKGLWNTPAK